MTPADIERLYDARGKYERLVQTLCRMRVDSRKSKIPPPKDIPASLRDAYLMNGLMEFHDMYFDSSVNPGAIGGVIPYEPKEIDTIVENVSAGRYKSYGRTNEWLRAALTKYPVRGKRVLIAGSVYPQYECFTLLFGGYPVTVEYNPRMSTDDRLVFFTPDQFNALGIRLESAIAISSYEHDGLGRYGDPLNPDGDLIAMRQLKEHLEPGALAYVSVPIGLDSLVWNAHRIYGAHRLPLFLRDWEIVDIVCDTSPPCDVRDGRIVIDEKRWQSSFVPSKSAPEWVFVLRNS